MKRQCALGVDIGTSSSKGVLVDVGTGAVLAEASLDHGVDRPQPGWVEMSADAWWREFVTLSKRLLGRAQDAEVVSVGASGMGPCVLLADSHGEPVRPAILYGVDTRATAQIARMNHDLSEKAIVEVAGSPLSAQAAGPKMLWVAEREGHRFDRARRLFMPASWIVHHLTGEYVLDHQAASQCTPFYDIRKAQWYLSWWERYIPTIERPRLAWAREIVGRVSPTAAAETGLPPGVPVIAGTIDAWAEAVSVDSHNDGDLMIMYGTTMFLIATGERVVRTPTMWSTRGALPGTSNLAGGLATSGALTNWLSVLTGEDYSTLISEAERSRAGARGMMILPYFAGERTPILDPEARGVIAGLTLDHTRGDLYRAVLEATAFGVRHNILTMQRAGAAITRAVAVGGGTRSRLWLQIVSDVTGLSQHIPRVTTGASFGSAFLAASSVSDAQIDQWNPIIDLVEPDAARHEQYRQLFKLYLRLYTDTQDVTHALARRQMAESSNA